MRTSRTALRFVSAAVGVSLAISALTACGDSSTSNSGVPSTPRMTWTNNVFYHDGQYYCVYPFGARELCSYAVGPDDGLSIAEENWIEAKEPGNYNPDSDAFASVVWSMYLLNLDWFDDIIDDVYKGTKKAKYKSSLKSKLAQSKKANRDDLKKVNSGSWTPPASPLPAPPKDKSNKGTKDCAFGTVNSDIELAAYPALTNGGSSGSRNGTNGGTTGNQNGTNGGNANGGNANGSVSNGQTGGTGTERLPNNRQQPRNNGC